MIWRNAKLQSAARGHYSPGELDQGSPTTFTFVDHEELVATSPSQRNWRGIGIALLVILVVCALIVTAVVVLTPADSGPRIGERFALEDILGDKFSVQKFNGTWISDKEFAFRREDGALMLYDASTQNVSLFVPNYPFKFVNAQLWYLSPDRKYLLLAYDIAKVFRHSFLAFYQIYNIETEHTEDLTPEPPHKKPLQHAEWGPVGNSIAFVYENNVYYKPSAESEDIKTLSAHRLEDFVFSGIPDWLYEEEILSDSSALWFAKDGTMLCFATFNDSAVPPLTFEWYGDAEHPLLYRYPAPQTIKYPKPGFPNPTVQLLVVNLTEAAAEDAIVERPLNPPPEILQTDHYFTAVTWISEREIAVTWMNRRQNISVITICTAPLWYCNETYREETGKRGWVDQYDAPIFSSNGRKYFFRGAAQDGMDGYFRQVFMKDLTTGRVNVLTHGKGEVVKVEEYDENEGYIYYTGAPEGKPGERHIYRINEQTASLNKNGECLTCNLGPDCLYNKAQFSTDAQYYVLDCQGPGTPKTFLVDSRSNNISVVLEPNAELAENLANKTLPLNKTFKIAVPGGYVANVKLLLPPGYKENSVTQYPMVVDVYGGPGSQLVSEKFQINWGTYLASNKNIIYAMIDGRGSGYQGEKRMHELYRRLGTVEVEDQIAVTKYLKENCTFVNKDKVAIWGWSYGGYVTAMIMGTDSDTFKCGISVAPVTNWAFYDSVYTERYMGFPTSSDNEDGYGKSDVLKRVKNFKDKMFYLIHGTADDNVHFQQSMMLSKALAHADILFRAQVYPDENHSLYGVKRHLYLSLEDFLQECFRDPVPHKMQHMIPEVDGEEKGE